MAGWERKEAVGTSTALQSIKGIAGAFGLSVVTFGEATGVVAVVVAVVVVVVVVDDADADDDDGGGVSGTRIALQSISGRGEESGGLGGLLAIKLVYRDRRVDL